MNSSQIQLDQDKEVTFFIPKEVEVNLENMQLEINCGFNMYNKKIKIVVQSESHELELPEITLSQMYKLQIPVELPENNPAVGKVKKLVIRPCQKNNYPVYIGIISK